MRRAAPLVSALAALHLGCGASKPAAESAPSAERGRTIDDPVMTCGALESYQYVARYRCPDGTTPLGGDPKQGARARLGSDFVKATNHHVDLYEVPCSGGAVRLYVDLYGCPEEQQRLAAVQGGTQEGHALEAAFNAGEFAHVLERCGSLPPEPKHDEKALCSALVPAALHGQGKHEEGFQATEAACDRFPPSTPENRGRATHIAVMMTALAVAGENGKFSASPEERQALVERWLSVCKVEKKELQEVMTAAGAEADAPP